MRLRVVFAGTPAFAVAALDAIHPRHEVVGVLTQPDRPAGRGRQLAPSPVKQRALALGLPVLQPLALRGDTDDVRSAIATLQSWRPDIMVVVAYGLILPPAVLALPPLGCLNIHASLLPRWRGAAPIQRAILAGDAETGVTIMQMDAGLDTGAMLLRRAVSVGAEATAAELHDRLAVLGGELVTEVLDLMARGTPPPPVAQPEAGVTYAAKLGKAEGQVDWTDDAAVVDRRIRAFNPWPAAQAFWRGEPVKLLRSRCLDAAGSPGAPPGTVLGLHDDALVVACGRGRVGLTQLQRAGRRAVGAADFANAELAAVQPPRFG